MKLLLVKLKLHKNYEKIREGISSKTTSTVKYRIVNQLKMRLSLLFSCIVLVSPSSAYNTCGNCQVSKTIPRLTSPEPDEMEKEVLESHIYFFSGCGGLLQPPSDHSCQYRVTENLIGMESLQTYANRTGS